MSLLDESSDQMEGGGPGLPQFQEAPPRETHHDPWLTPASLDLRAIASRLFDDIENHCPRPARQRGDARERRRAMVENLVANFVLLDHRRGSRLAVSAKNEKASRYSRRGFRTATLMTVIGNLEARHWVSCTPGVANKLRTLLEPSPQLCALVQTTGATAVDLERLPGAETIILKAYAGRNRPKPLIDYTDTAETSAMRAAMETINATLSAADIRLAGRAMPPPHLVRIFQAASLTDPHQFDSYGRLYRGFWQTLPRGQRHHLTINGEAVADLDFKAMFVQLAYARQGAPPPQGDPYAVPGLEQHREAVKKAVSALFSRSTPIRRLSPELRELLPDGWTRERLMGAIRDHHPAISPLLGADIAPSLTRTESDIMVDVLLRLAFRGVAVLPIHDGLCVGVSHKVAAIRTMQDVSEMHTGWVLPVEEKRSDPASLTAP
ncbi:MAG: hypothetical protein KKB66_13145 [Alphaproteobacteria bacterium]|nr:hypothetical protein [Alphaproteobacteria bacterium]MBU0805352.1 hypothetical protein [Alphaproteobacteria bacterium]MBU0873298.1 hypothetical protein [Alphaproteobacteria bacterium]MBU1401474.1 hypothetical protein [Alphaproteobacteria bacterium]MBU1592109.1 hypothetical protein [Alphaproteobacteria bacterium]